MASRSCVSGCGRFLASSDGHDRCVSCLGFQHAEAALVDDSCSLCGNMTIAMLRSRYLLVKRGGIPLAMPSWRAPFSARNRPSTSSVLTTLDGGAAQGYVEIPPVERAIAMQLCPQGAAAWRGNPRLPSRACKFSSALTAKAYSAAGQAASALHAMALLQVHQAKALKQLHEGGADPAGLQELRTATDLALRATKVTARALGQTMSTLVVQERHLWLTLADMRESDKHRFLDAPISQAGLFGEAVEGFAQQFSAAQQQTEAF